MNIWLWLLSLCGVLWLFLELINQADTLLNLLAVGSIILWGYSLFKIGVK